MQAMHRNQLCSKVYHLEAETQIGHSAEGAKINKSLTIRAEGCVVYRAALRPEYGEQVNGGIFLSQNSVYFDGALQLFYTLQCL